MIVFVEGIKHNIVEPKPATLKKYGLDFDAWRDILVRQEYRCPICKKVPSSGIFRTDHFHAQNYKTMKPEKKRKFVRGLTCVHCNRFYLAKGITIEKSKNVTKYLEDFEMRLSK